MTILRFPHFQSLQEELVFQSPWNPRIPCKFILHYVLPYSQKIREFNVFTIALLKLRADIISTLLDESSFNSFAHVERVPLFWSIILYRVISSCPDRDFLHRMWKTLRRDLHKRRNRTSCQLRYTFLSRQYIRFSKALLYFKLYRYVQFIIIHARDDGINLYHRIFCCRHY